MQLIAGITTYNPKIELLLECIHSIQSQVNEIIIVDNCSENIDTFFSLLSNYNNITIIRNPCNAGLSKAQNRILTYAKDNNYEWCLLLDQDSICPPNLVSEYSRHITDDNIGIISPIIYDRNTEHLLCNNLPEIEKVDLPINSGACVNVDAWIKVGKYDELLFIDSIDHDFSIRLTKAGYTLYRCNQVILNHAIGDAIICRGKRISYHNSFRLFYISESLFYLRKKHGRICCNQYASLRNPVLNRLKRIIIIILYEDDKCRKIGAIFRGVYSGIKLGKKCT